jgi:transcriptional regulator with XRE-family HTH domain
MSKLAALPSDETQKPRVDDGTMDRIIAEKRIGERIRQLRLKKQIGLVELGRRAGLSASFLSQLETGRVVPTLKNLARIAMVFSKDLSYFFESEPRSVFRIHRPKDRVRLPQTGVMPPNYYFESLACLVPDREMDPFFAEFMPLTPEMKARSHVHPGFEFLYVMEGALEVRHGEQVNVLETGDAVYFDSSTPHSYQCAGKEPSRAIIVTMHTVSPSMLVPARAVKTTPAAPTNGVSG